MRIKSQSAMEYLMTYGWAILIMATVIAALYELGVFSIKGPAASPGSCQVNRPDGPGTADFISLTGPCTGQMPQYVAQFSGSSTSNVLIPPSVYLRPNSITITGWSNLLQAGTDSCYTQNLANSENTGESMGYALIRGWATDQDSYISNGITWTQAGSVGGVPINTWVFQAVTYSTFTGNEILYYGNGTLTDNVHVYGTLVTSTSQPVLIGGGCKPGELADIQIYNTALSQNDIIALYQEGIGGAPINLQHLVGWWPLNGNANDYSGNGNDGAASNLIYIQNWQTGYTAP